VVDQKIYGGGQGVRYLQGVWVMTSSSVHAKLGPEYERQMQAALECLWNGTYKNLNQAALAEDELVLSVMLRAEASKRPSAETK
jgi:hypothetical protein